MLNGLNHARLSLILPRLDNLRPPPGWPGDSEIYGSFGERAPVETETRQERSERGDQTGEKWGEGWFEDGPLPMMAFDRESFAILAVNEAAIRFYGYSRKEFLTMSVKDIRRQEAIPQLFGAIQAGDRGVRGPFIGQHKKKDGTFVDVEVQTQRQTLQSRTVILAEIHDVTEQKRAESTSQEREEELTAIYEHAPLIMLLVDGERHVKKANKSAELFAGTSSAELLGLRAGEALRCRHANDDPSGCGFGRDCPRCVVRATVIDTFHTGRSHQEIEATLPFDIAGKVEQLTLLLYTARVIVHGQPHVLVTIQDISERKRREQEIQKLTLELRNERLRLVTDPAMAQLTMDELMPELLRRLRTALSADTANLLLLTSDGEYLDLRASEGMEEKAKERIRIPVGHGIAGRIAAAQEPVIIDDISKVEVISPALRDKIKSLAGVPLRVEGRLIGVVHVGKVQRQGFNSEDISFLKLVADRMALAVDNAAKNGIVQLSQAELAGEHSRLQLLLEINNALVVKRDTRELFAAISASLRRVTHHLYSQIVLYDPETRQLVVRAVDFPAGGKGLIHEGLVVPLEHSPAGLAYVSAKPLLIANLERNRFPSDTTERLLQEGVKSICLAPLISHDQVLGALSIGRSEEASFSTDDLEMLVAVANQVSIAIENALAFEKISELNQRLATENVYLDEEVRANSGFENIIGESKGLKQVQKQVETAAPTDATVLLLGETGTGKELIARAIHDLSERSKAAFIKLNCSAIPTGLLESELFGHEKGAFTGATERKIGRLELAHQGTLFLDEVGDLPVELQPKLLRVLQDGDFERLGGTKTIHTDVRLIAATNRDLVQMVEDLTFREDLYYRLKVFPITIPPLRERATDIPILVTYFVEKYARQMKKKITTIPQASMQALMKWEWPGNIRELQNFLHRAVILSPGPALEVPVAELGNGRKRAAPKVATLEDAEREHILRVLRETKGLIGTPQGAAVKLGMKRTTLYAKMRKLGITRRDFMT